MGSDSPYKGNGYPSNAGSAGIVSRKQAESVARSIEDNCSGKEGCCPSCSGKSSGKGTGKSACKACRKEVVLWRFALRFTLRTGCFLDPYPACRWSGLLLDDVERIVKRAGADARRAVLVEGKLSNPKLKAIMLSDAISWP